MHHVMLWEVETDVQAMCGGSHTMALTDQGHLFTWGRCTNGRQGFDAQATVQLPHQIHMPGGSERWHPICIAAGGRHSMCMALPRQTVKDHARRQTVQSESSSWIGRVSDMFTACSAPVLTGMYIGALCPCS
jgi:Regulator of chromosome condensation (RCC1) repeat